MTFLRVTAICAILTLVVVAVAGRIGSAPTPVQHVDTTTEIVKQDKPTDRNGRLIRTIPVYTPSPKQHDKPNRWYPQYPSERGSTPQRQSDVDVGAPFGPQVGGSSPPSSTNPSVAETPPVAEQPISAVEAYCNRPGKGRNSWIRIKGVKYWCKE